MKIRAAIRRLNTHFDDWRRAGLQPGAISSGDGDPRRRSGGLDGHLRAYGAASGRIIWDVDTKGSYQTVNETTGFGGSLDGPGPVVVGGLLYVTSGYAHYGGAPGNVLLAFSVGGK